MKFTDLAIRIPQHVIIGGDPKSGKSTLVAQLAEQGFKLLWFSLDNGHSVLAKLSKKAQENIEIIVLPDTKDFPVAIDTIKKVLTKSGEHKICDRHGQVSCLTCVKEGSSFSIVDLLKLANDPENTWIVVIDNISQLADSGENYVRKAGKLADDDKTEWDHYSHWQFLMKSCMSAIQVAPYNIICLAHLVESEMEDGKKKLVPMVGSSVYSRKVGGYFDHVVFIEIENMSHKAASASTFRASVLTGSRADVVLEKQAKMTLLPFFDGTFKKVEQAGDIKHAQEILAKTSNVEPVSTVSGSTSGIAHNNGNGAINNDQPGAGVVTNMHSPSSNALAALQKLRNK